VWAAGLGLVALVASAAPASAQRTPVTTRPSTTVTTRPSTTTTTSRTLDSAAARARVVQTADLPTGYVLDDLRTETGAPAAYPTVDKDCEIEQTRFSGSPQSLATVLFTNDRTRGSGHEALASFSSSGTAEDYVEKFADAYAELADCGKTVAPTGAIGTYRTVKLGKVGDTRSGLVFEPTGTDFPSWFAVVQTGNKAIYVDLYDKDATDATFATLVKAATQRSK
jgi:hypothetical protein